jgi:hypothetical protein
MARKGIKRGGHGDAKAGDPASRSARERGTNGGLAGRTGLAGSPGGAARGTGSRASGGRGTTRRSAGR